MKRHIRSGLISAVFGIIAFAAAAPSAHGQGILSKILERMDLNNKSLQSIKADVTMAKHNPQLNVTDVSIGSTSYLLKSGKRDRYVRIDWVKPMEEQVAVIGDRYELYRKHTNQVITGTVNKAKNNAAAGGALAFLNMSREQLKANYTVQYLGEEQVKGGVPTWRLLLTPKVQSSYKTAELWVDKDGMPRQAKVTELNNDTTTVLLENIQKNVTLRAEVFKLNYPKNAKRIQA
jgi:outer membrane lipoprotein-sorting protein